jgi:hypothetical protein
MDVRLFIKFSSAMKINFSLFASCYKLEVSFLYLLSVFFLISRPIRAGVT